MELPVLARQTSILPGGINSAGYYQATLQKLNSSLDITHSYDIVFSERFRYPG